MEFKKEVGQRIRPLRLAGSLALAWAVAAGQATAQVRQATTTPAGTPPTAAGVRPAPGPAAHVYAVPTSGEASRFQVPQVRLANTAAARRINRQLLRLVLAGEFEGVDSTASPQWQLAQAAHECCYDADAKQWLAAGQGFTGCSYKVLFNQGGLLSLGIMTQYTGAYSWEQPQYLTFDLRTGRLLTLADVVADSPDQLSQRLSWAINRRLGDELAQLAKYGEDTARIAYAAEQFQWDQKTHQSKNPNLGLGDPAEFALTPQRLLLFYRVGFPHAALDLEPDDTYRFAYRTLHLRPRLAAALASPPPAQKK